MSNGPKIDWTKISEFEKKTREIFSNVDGSSENVMISKVMIAMYSHSIPRVQIEDIACAMYGVEGVNFEKPLAALVKAKALRATRARRGDRTVTFYEVNY